MGLSAGLLSQHGPISSATQPNMALSAAPFSLTWTYQHSLTASHGHISSATQPFMGLSAPPFNLTWASQ